MLRQGPLSPLQFGMSLQVAQDVAAREDSLRSLRTVTCAASTSRKRNSEFPNCGMQESLGLARGRKQLHGDGKSPTFRR